MSADSTTVSGALPATQDHGRPSGFSPVNMETDSTTIAEGTTVERAPAAAETERPDFRTGKVWTKEEVRLSFLSLSFFSFASTAGSQLLDESCACRLRAHALDR